MIEEEEDGEIDRSYPLDTGTGGYGMTECVSHGSSGSGYEGKVDNGTGVSDT